MSLKKVLISTLICLPVAGFSDSDKSEKINPPPKISMNVDLKYEVKGDMDREAIRKVIRENLGGIRACYNTGIQKTPDIHGRLTLEWEIGDGGKVTSAKALEPFNQTVDDCIKGVIRAAKWPEPLKGQVVRVRYPFVFSYE